MSKTSDLRSEQIGGTVVRFSRSDDAFAIARQADKNDRPEGADILLFPRATQRAQDRPRNRLSRRRE